MKFAVYAFTIGLLCLAGVVVWTILRVEDTREQVQVIRRTITVDPCKKARSESCQRRIALVLHELARQHPGELKRLGLAPREIAHDARDVGGGGATRSPQQGGGPVGRVSPPRHTPPSGPVSGPVAPPEPNPEPLVHLDAPVAPRVCVGDLVGVNDC